MICLQGSLPIPAACLLALSGQGGVDFGTLFPAAFTLAVVYKPSATTTNLGFITGRKDGTSKNGVSVPRNHASTGNYGLNINSATPVHGASPQDTSTTDPLIMILRRDGTADTGLGGNYEMTGYGTIDGGTAVSFGNITSAAAQGGIYMDALFRVDSNTNADVGFGLAYMVAYFKVITDAEVFEELDEAV